MVPAPLPLMKPRAVLLAGDVPEAVLLPPPT
jgi:hypothetical protein